MHTRAQHRVFATPADFAWMAGWGAPQMRYASTEATCWAICAGRIDDRGEGCRTIDGAIAMANVTPTPLLQTEALLQSLGSPGVWAWCRSRSIRHV